MFSTSIMLNNACLAIVGHDAQQRHMPTASRNFYDAARSAHTLPPGEFRKHNHCVTRTCRELDDVAACAVPRADSPGDTVPATKSSDVASVAVPCVGSTTSFRGSRCRDPRTADARPRLCPLRMRPTFSNTLVTSTKVLSLAKEIFFTEKAAAA